MTIVVGEAEGTWDVLDELGRVVATCYDAWVAETLFDTLEEDAYTAGWEAAMAAMGGDRHRAWIGTSTSGTALPHITPIVVAPDEARAREMLTEVLRAEALASVTFKLCEVDLGAAGVDLLPHSAALRRVTPGTGHEAP